MAPTLVTITANEVDGSGTAAEGYVIFEPNTVWRLPNDNKNVERTPIKRDLVAGALSPSLQLIATDTAGITTDDAKTPKYRIEKHLAGLARPQIAYILVPVASAPTLDLADAPVVSP